MNSLTHTLCRFALHDSPRRVHVRVMQTQGDEAAMTLNSATDTRQFFSVFGAAYLPEQHAEVHSRKGSYFYGDADSRRFNFCRRDFSAGLRWSDQPRDGGGD